MTISKKAQLEKAADREEAIAALRAKCPRDSRVYTSVKHVSRSGMQRTIGLYVVTDGEVDDISVYVSRALGWRRDYRRGGLIVDGCGMDMCFHTVYVLASVLFPRVPGERDSGYLLKAHDL